MKVLVTADLDKRIESEFPDLQFDYMGYAVGNHIPSAKEELLAVIADYDFLVCEFDTIDKDLIDTASKLKMIVCCRGGVHSVIDVNYAAKKGIIVKNTPGRNASSVAEYVLGVMFTMDRQLFHANSLVLSDTLQKEKYVLPENYRDSLWGMDSSSPYHRFRGKGIHGITLGVIGYGNVGRIVVNMAVILGIHVLVYNHHPIMTPVPAGVEVVELDYLLRHCDFISLHCSNREHKPVLGEAEFRKMKDKTYLINTARGDVLDEAALIRALDSGKLAGAALDVTQQEPLPMNSPLIKAKNIIITPHIAGAADEVIQIGTDMTIYHIREFLSDIWREG